MLEQTKQQMAAMRLNGMLAALEEQIANPPHQLSFDERISLLIDREYLHRENQRLSNRLKQAKLKSNCSVEQVDFHYVRGLQKSRFLSLANASWIKHHRSIIITGPTGIGKTFLAQALAHKACLMGYTARYYRTLHLIHDAVIAYREGKLQRFLATVTKFDVLLIDDFGMMVMDDEQKRLLLEILEHRYELCSTVITSQLSVEHWHGYLNDPLIADAFLDRIVHQSEKFVLTGESLRKIKHKKENNESEIVIA